MLLCCMEIEAKLTIAKIEFTIKAIVHAAAHAQYTRLHRNKGLRMYSYLVNHS